jgi:GNAT superfamily N-acetyltransferase
VAEIPLDVTPEQLAPGFEFRPAWRLGDPQIARDATDFWSRLALLPAKVSAEERVKELSAVAYRDGRLVGVTTVRIGRLDQVRARLAMLRGAVDPEFRRTRVGFALALCTRHLLQAWAKEHPEERLGGLGAIVEAAELADRAKEPYWPTTRFILAGFMPDGRQIRVSWFDDFLLDP